VLSGAAEMRGVIQQYCDLSVIIGLANQAGLQ
jgi:hypothetical protein